jgi:hypothetical protein
MRLASVVWIALALGGCRVFAPVVGEDDVRMLPMNDGCDAIPACARLEEPLAPALAVGDIDFARDGCPTGRVAQTLTLDRQVTLDAETLRCTDLSVDVASTTTEARSVGLTLTGLALDDASISIRSLGAPITLRIDTPQIDSVDLTIDGAVHATLARTDITSTRVHLRGAAPLEAPSLWVDHARVHDVAIDGPRSDVRAVDSGLDRVVVVARSVALEAGTLQRGHVIAELFESLDADVGATTIEAGHLAATGQNYQAVQLVRCGSAAFFGVHVRRSRIARCDDVVEIDRTWIDDTIVEADVMGQLPTFQQAVLSGRSIVADDGIVGASALCGVSHLDVARLHCVRCEAAAPPDSCIVDAARTELCPGLCAATCERTQAPTLVQREACSP